MHYPRSHFDDLLLFVLISMNFNLVIFCVYSLCFVLNLTNVMAIAHFLIIHLIVRLYFRYFSHFSVIRINFQYDMFCNNVNILCVSDRDMYTRCVYILFCLVGTALLFILFVNSILGLAVYYLVISVTLVYCSIILTICNG